MSTIKIVFKTKIFLLFILKTYIISATFKAEKTPSNSAVIKRIERHTESGEVKKNERANLIYSRKTKLLIR